MLGAALLIWPSWSSTKKKLSTKSTAASSSKKKRSTKKTAAGSSKKRPTTRKASSKGRASSRSRRTATTWRNRQLAPSAERYTEIQRALAEKGYLKSEPTGSWGSESIEALRGFQRDQNLDPSGKIDSVSLIALGLGPKYETAKAPAPPSDSVQP